ncbi:MAG: hypothetical protein ACJAQT_003998 [Akkermansiaceae bacterium]|jgi:hypothetical protein
MNKPASSAQEFVDESTMLPIGHIPAIARMCHRVGLIDLINESIPCNTDVGSSIKNHAPYRSQK